MKKAFKILIALIALMAVPALAGLGIMALWNGFIPTICGFATITYCQAVALFLLGQLLSGGFILALFFGFWSLHAVMHPRGDLRTHWRNMSDEDRRAFILRRREYFGFSEHPQDRENASEK